jgi:hypothetical protein
LRDRRRDMEWALNKKLESDSVKNDKSKESDLETTKQICVNRKPALSKECLYTEEDLSKLTLRSKDSLEELKNESKSNNEKQRPKKDSDSMETSKQTKDANSKSSDIKNCAIVSPKVSAETKHENISEIDDEEFKLYQN